jgi:nascent polypeptide-associated complex subunit alpha
MLPGINPREMQKAMKRLGIKQEEIDAELVIIKTNNKDLVIKNPHVSKVNMMGQETFQIAGELTEVEMTKTEVSDEDVSTVMEQANCSRESALNALEESNGDLAKAILRLQNK